MLTTTFNQVASNRALPKRPFHPRKGHSKSRNGCDACKRRKKKCDEVASGCSECLSQNIKCRYNSVGRLSGKYQRTLRLSPTVVVSYNCLPGLKPDEIELFHHFHTQTLGTLGSSSVEEVIGGCLPAALELDFLKHAVLTVAASHLAFLSQCRDTKTSHHLDKALSTFCQRLSHPITAPQVDAVLTNCVLLNAMAFFDDHNKNSNSCLFTGATNSQWLSVQVGLRTIMSNARHLLKGSAWAIAYLKQAQYFHGRFRGPFEDDDPNEEVPEDLRNLYGITLHSNSGNNIYYSTLVSLLTLDSSSVSLTQLMAIMHRFGPEFYQLIRSRDLRALLLLTIWLSLMCDVNLWWISGRATTECFACCQYLDRYGDDVIRKFLWSPSQRCGYKMVERDT